MFENPAPHRFHPIHAHSVITKTGKISVAVQATSGNNFLGMASIRDRLVEAGKAGGAAAMRVDGALRELCDRAGPGTVLPLADVAGAVPAEDSVELGGAGGPILTLADIRQACPEELSAITDLVRRAVEGRGPWEVEGPHYVVLAGGACRLPPVREAVVAALSSMSRPAWDTKLVQLSAEQATVQVAKGNAFIAAAKRASPLVPAKFKLVNFVDRTTNDLRIKVNGPAGPILALVMPSGTPVGEDYPSTDELQSNLNLESYVNARPVTINPACLDQRTGTCANRAAGRGCSCKCNMEYTFYEVNSPEVEGKTPCGSLQLLVSIPMLQWFNPGPPCLAAPMHMLKHLFQARMLVSGMVHINVYMVVGEEPDHRRILRLATTGTFSLASQSHAAGGGMGEEGGDTAAMLLSLLRSSVLDACANLEYNAGLVRQFWCDDAAADRFEALASSSATAAEAPDATFPALQTTVTVLQAQLDASRELMQVPPTKGQAVAGGSGSGSGTEQLGAARLLRSRFGVIFSVRDPRVAELLEERGSMGSGSDNGEDEEEKGGQEQDDNGCKRRRLGY